MKGKRGMPGQRAHALPMQEPGHSGLAAQMLLVRCGSERRPGEDASVAANRCAPATADGGADLGINSREDV
jgi:hypothetical protein